MVPSKPCFGERLHWCRAADSADSKPPADQRIHISSSLFFPFYLQIVCTRSSSCKVFINCRSQRVKFLPFKCVCATHINHNSKLKCPSDVQGHTIKATVDRYEATFTKLTVDFFPELIWNYLFSPETSGTAIT